MKDDQQGKRRPAGAMAGHAFALAWLSREADQRSARAMATFERMRQSGSVTPRGRMMILSGLAGGAA